MEVTDYIKNIPDGERRFAESTLEFEKRDDGVNENVIEGYAAVFNKDSENFGGWVERIAPGAFDDVLKDEAFALFNHDANLVLGRNGVNVKLTQDDVGLRYRIELKDTTTSNDLKELVRQGIINKSSFAFIVREHQWTYSEDASIPSVRTIRKIKRLYDVAPVTYPAYPDTTVAARSMSKPNDKDNVADAEFVRSIETILQKEEQLTKQILNALENE